MTKFCLLKILIMEGQLMFTNSPFAHCCEDNVQLQLRSSVLILAVIIKI